MSAKRPRARRSRMWRSVSVYGSARVAPIASSPSSAPRAWSSAASTGIVCPGAGTNAELIAVPESNVHPIPGDLSFEEAAAFPLVFETAYRMLVTRARLQEGEWVFTWGIGSGVSTAVLAIAKALGARVIVTSSSDARSEERRVGKEC